MKPFSYYRPRISLFILALFLWLFVITSREYEIIQEVPLTVENIRTGKVLMGDIPQTARVQFKGIGRSLILLKLFHDAKVSLDLSTIKEYYDYPSSQANVKIPSSLKVEAVSILYPDTVFIRLDEKVERSLPISVNSELKVKPGYVIVGQAYAEPGEVLVSGPLSVIKDIHRVRTKKIIQKELKKDLNITAELLLPHRQVELSIPSVQVNVKVERLAETIIKNIPIKVFNAPKHYTVKVQPPALSVKIRGPVSAIKQVDSRQISASISCPSVWKGTANAFVPAVGVPAGLELVEIQPETVYTSLLEE